MKIPDEIEQLEQCILAAFQTGRELYGAMRAIDQTATDTFTSTPPKRR